MIPSISVSGGSAIGGAENLIFIVRRRAGLSQDPDSGDDDFPICMRSQEMALRDTRLVKLDQVRVIGMEERDSYLIFDRPDSWMELSALDANDRETT